MSHPTFDFPIERHRLANGLDVVLQPDSRLPLVAVNLWYHVGSKNERPGKTGLAHLFEHMLFQGSAHVGTNDHFTHLQRVGGVANGSTWYDRTNYYETVPAHELELALWLESDRMGFLLETLTAEKLENQREVVMNERRQRIDNQPYGLAFEHLFERLFPPLHPYSWPVIGTMDDIAAIELEDVSDFFSTYYRPNNAVLTLAGHFEPAAARALVQRYFGELAAGQKAGAIVAPPLEERGEIRTVLPDEVELPRVYAAYRIPPFGTREWLIADVLTTALSSGKSSPLHRDLVYERQIAQNVSAGALPTEIDGSVLLTATGRPDTDPEALLAAVDEHLEAARERPLPPEAFERSRNRLLTAYTDQLQSVETRADLLSQSATFLGDPARYTDRLEAYASIEAAEVVSFATAALAPENRAVVTVVPKSAAGSTP